VKLGQWDHLNRLGKEALSHHYSFKAILRIYSRYKDVIPFYVYLNVLWNFWRVHWKQWVESFKKIPAAEGTIEYRNNRDAFYLMLFGDDPTRVWKTKPYSNRLGSKAPWTFLLWFIHFVSPQKILTESWINRASQNQNETPQQQFNNNQTKQISDKMPQLRTSIRNELPLDLHVVVSLFMQKVLHQVKRHLTMNKNAFIWIAPLQQWRKFL